MFRKIALSPWTALITLSLMLMIRVADPAFVESVRLRYFDTLILSKPAQTLNIWNVNLDEAALSQRGQWPLPRSEWSKIIQDLYDRKAGLVVLDVLMADADRISQDSQLAATLKKYPVILVSTTGDQNKNSARNPGAAIINAEHQDQIIEYPGIIANVPVLENAAVGVGLVNTLPELDGVTRRMPLVSAVNGELYPSLALETLRVLAGDSNFQIKLQPGGVEKLRIPQFGAISTDNLSRVWIDWSQQPQTATLDQLPADFQGAVVIVGVTAPGIANPVATAQGSVWPQHLQAAVIGTLANGVVIERPDYADGAEIVLIGLGGVMLILLTHWTYLGLATTLILAVAGVAGSHWLYQQHLWLFDATAFTTSVILVALHAYGVKFLSEFLQKQQIKRQFGGYVSPVIVERLQQNPELIRLGGESRELSIVMTDMRNFTALGESYGDRVEEFTNTMNSYMTAISEPIMQNQGCLIKFIGDASLHVHGAPLDDANHAANAVQTALDMLQAVEQFNQQLADQGRPPVGMGVGINTGVTLIGNIGSRTRFGYDVLGDSVSLAARLEGQSKPYGVKIVIGPVTAAQAADRFFLVKLDDIAVKGKKQGVEIFTVVDTQADAPKDYQIALQGHNLMLQAYSQQKWSSAEARIEALKGSFDSQLDLYYDMMLDRIKALRQIQLPADWDGVYRSNTK